MPLKTEHRYLIPTFLRRIFKRLKEAISDLFPIILVISIFQVAVLRQPFPQLLEVLIGAGLVVIGLMLFVQGLKWGYSPSGKPWLSRLQEKGV